MGSRAIETEPGRLLYWIERLARDYTKKAMDMDKDKIKPDVIKSIASLVREYNALLLLNERIKAGVLITDNVNHQQDNNTNDTNDIDMINDDVS